MNKHTLNLLRAVEREKIRNEFTKAVAETTQRFNKVIAYMKSKWPKRQTEFYRN
jgi:hypothetical protein